MKKKFLALILIIIGVFSLTACSSTKYVCETDSMEYLVLISDTQYKFYKDNVVIEKGSYSFKTDADTDTDLIFFRPYNPDLTAAKINERLQNEDYTVFLEIGQYAGIITNNTITVAEKSYKKT